MAAVGQVDNSIFSVLAHIAALDLGSGVIWGREFISDVRFIVLHTAYLESKFKMAAVAPNNSTNENYVQKGTGGHLGFRITKIEG